MSILKTKLFELNKGLTEDQQDIALIVAEHIAATDKYSDLEVGFSIKKNLDNFRFYENVNAFLSEVDGALSSDKLVHQLRDLYKKLERQDNGNLYQYTLKTLLEIANESDDQTRMGRIVNELVVHDWIPEVKTFLYNLNSNPNQKVNVTAGGGTCENVYGIAFSVDEGILAYVKDRWFLLNENEISVALLENYVKDEVKIRQMRMLQEAITHGMVSDTRIDFQLDESLTLGISLETPGKIFINNEEADKEMTLENIFSSAIVPYLNKSYYNVVNECANNTDKFVELDVICKVSNMAKAHLEYYCFNYGNSVYALRCDKKYSTSLYRYDSAASLVSEVKRELGYDLTQFFENKVSSEMKKLKSLEDRELKIKESLAKINSVLEEITNLGTSSKELKKLEDQLLIKKHKLNEDRKLVLGAKNRILNS